MRVRFSVFIGTSLDGFIARRNGDMAWMGNSGLEPANEDYGYKAFIASVDTVVMGRNTFGLAASFNEWPYTGKQVVVLSSGSVSLPESLFGSVEIMACSPAELAVRLSDNGARHVYVDGGKTIQQFLVAGLIDMLTITRIPILIGDGVPLFGEIERDIRFQHIQTKAYKSGFVQSTYRRLANTQ